MFDPKGLIPEIWCVPNRNVNMGRHRPVTLTLKQTLNRFHPMPETGLKLKLAKRETGHFYLIGARVSLLRHGWRRCGNLRKGLG
ncbi:hypothetical protein [Pannonibacter sp.]|uniref:hypothetical protein n=1 Tax=Pannonibacter sp. TaxID=1906786 RepID=UPI003F6FF1C8